MFSRPRAMATGAWAVLVAPQWITGVRLARLLAPAPDDALGKTFISQTGSGGGEETVAVAIGTGRHMLRLLARFPKSPWRNTCLFRSVAECLTLRQYGVPALLRIGVRPASEPAALHEAARVEAHAWVETETSSEGGYVVFQAANKQGMGEGAL